MLEEEKESPISLGQWLINFLILAIPLVGFIMLIVWAVSSDVPKTKQNWARARLIVVAIGLFLVIVFWGFFIAIFAAGAGGGFDNFNNF